MKLTDEQIAELAPEWAERYFMNELGDIVFESAEIFAVMNKNTQLTGSKIANLYGFDDRSKPIQRKSKPIPRKPEPFDITQHEWSDEDIEFDDGAESLLNLSVNYEDNYHNETMQAGFFLTRLDAIAIAKHFGLTAEDLK